MAERWQQRRSLQPKKEVYYASDHERIWGYDAIFGRYGGGNEPGWQFGVSVNKPDNVEGNDGVHDDQSHRIQLRRSR